MKRIRLDIALAKVGLAWCAGILLIPASLCSQQLRSSSFADTWSATDGLGRSLDDVNYPAAREDRYVGIFYFVWQGAHGYDTHRGGTPDGGVMTKLPTDTISPHDITKLLQANPDNPPYGPLHAFHHWSEPYFGYYLADDEWVIRKHAQMLSDAGIDLIILDATNAAIYLPQVSKIARVYQQLRHEGISTPSMAFIVNSGPEATVASLYKEIYQKGLFSELWFQWKGKPLLLCPPEAAKGAMADFFTIRQSWAWSKGQQWFGDGKDKWPWLDHTPQSFGWHESPNKPEQISVAIAQHPMSNIGRSFHDGKQPEMHSTEKGLYFTEQWQRALEVDPELVFVTGWNEWVAMRFNDGASQYFLGKPIAKGETYFVDLYNAEFSRDAEPENGITQDHYYYQLTNYVRKFKGVRKQLPAAHSAPIRIDGRYNDWKKSTSIFQDDKGDVFHRKHPGWGRIKEYVNNSGRNDIVEARVSENKQKLFFYVKTDSALTRWDSVDWMRLFITVNQSDMAGWEGFQLLVNKTPLNSHQTTLSKYSAVNGWEEIAVLEYKVSGNELELAIPKYVAGIPDTSFVIDFKWVDNIPLNAGPMNWLDKGDAAPNGRFKYRYKSK